MKVDLKELKKDFLQYLDDTFEFIEEKGSSAYFMLTDVANEIIFFLHILQIWDLDFEELCWNKLSLFIRKCWMLVKNDSNVVH